MPLPSFLSDRPALEAANALESICVTVLSAFADEGVILSTELEYGWEDLSVVADFSALLAQETLAWHRTRGLPTDFRVVQRAFVHAFLCGLDLAVQLHRRDGEGLILEASFAGILDGNHLHRPDISLQPVADELRSKAEDVFVVFQDRALATAASVRNEILLHDFLACGYLWAGLAGVEAGLVALEAPAMA